MEIVVLALLPTSWVGRLTSRILRAAFDLGISSLLERGFIPPIAYGHSGIHDIFFGGIHHSTIQRPNSLPPPLPPRRALPPHRAGRREMEQAALGEKEWRVAQNPGEFRHGSAECLDELTGGDRGIPQGSGLLDEDGSHSVVGYVPE